MHVIEHDYLRRHGTPCQNTVNSCQVSGASRSGEFKRLVLEENNKGRGGAIIGQGNEKVYKQYLNQVEGIFIGLIFKNLQNRHLEEAADSTQTVHHDQGHYPNDHQPIGKSKFQTKRAKLIHFQPYEE